MCPVNSQNDEKLDYAFSLAQAVDVQQLIRCQIARSIHYTTSAIIVRLPEQPSAKFTIVLLLY